MGVYHDFRVAFPLPQNYVTPFDTFAKNPTAFVQFERNRIKIYPSVFEMVVLQTD